MYKIYFVFVLIILSSFSVNCKKGTYSGRRSSSSNSRSYSKSSPTSSSRTNYNTQSSGNYNTQRKSSQVGSTARYYPQPTQKPVYQQPVYTQRTGVQQNAYTQRPSYQQPYTQQPVYRQTQRTAQNVYTQRPYTQRPVYQQPVYNQKPAYPQQSYPKQSYPQQSNPSYHQPPYRPYQPSYTSNFGGGYNSPGGYYKKKDHTVRNTVLAGLGGSALGMYLGYKLGGYTSSLNNPNYGGYGGGGVGGIGGVGGVGGGYAPMPPYSVVHHYHHGDRPIIQDAKVEPSVIAPCKDVNFCTPNTTPLCMTNGTVYCVTPMGQTNVCNVNSTDLQCVTATITAPCLNDTDGNCNSTQLATENLEIPCVTSVNVFGDFSTNKLSVQNANNMTAQNTLTEQGINNKYCVTIIAEPLIEPKNLTNAEYAWYLVENPQAGGEADAKLNNHVYRIGKLYPDSSMGHAQRGHRQTVGTREPPLIPEARHILP